MFISFFGYSQSLDPVESKIEYKDEYAQCWKVLVSPEDDETKKAFKRFMKKRYDVKLKGIGMFSNKDVMEAEDVEISAISSKRLNFYVSVIDVDGLTEIKVFGNYGYSVFFDKEKFKDEYQALRTILVDFMNSYLPEYYQDRVKDAQKKHDEFVEKGEDLEEDIADDKKEIEKLKREIEDLQKELEENKEQIKQSKKNFNKTEEQFDELKSLLRKVK